MSFISRTFATLVTLFAASALAAHADTFTYSAYGPIHDGFTVTSSTLITTYTVFQSKVSCSVFGYSSCVSVTLDPVRGFATWYAQSQLPGGLVSEGFVIPPADFLAPGVYPALTIVDNSSGVTPEPSSFVLLGTGILGLASAVRRRYRKAQPHSWSV